MESYCYSNVYNILVNAYRVQQKTELINYSVNYTTNDSYCSH